MANPSETQKTSLYVGDLDPTVTDTDLRLAFSRTGHRVTSSRVCLDRVSGRSLCYGYVNFPTHLEAALALSLLNHQDLKGKPMRIMWSERNPFRRKTEIANVFVKNLDPTIDSTRLESMFCQFGPIISCKVATDDNGNSKGFGFIQYEFEESATAAIKVMNGTRLSGKQLYVGNFISSNQRNQTFTNLYVKIPNKDLTDEHLKQQFCEFGKVTSAVIKRDNLGDSMGYGFVNFESAEEAKAALEALNGVAGLSVERAEKRDQRARRMIEEKAKWKGSRLYVGNLDQSVDESLLKSHFRSSGFVLSADVIRYTNGISKGFGFVTFNNPDHAARAKVELHGSVLRGKSLHVDMAWGSEKPRSHSLPSSPSKTSMNQNYNSSFRVHVSYPKKGQDFRVNQKQGYPATGIHKTQLLSFISEKSRSSAYGAAKNMSKGSDKPSSQNLNLSVERTKMSGVEMKLKESDLLKLYASPNSLMELIKDALQMIAAGKARKPTPTATLLLLNHENA